MQKCLIHRLTPVAITEGISVWVLSGCAGAAVPLNRPRLHMQDALAERRSLRQGADWLNERGIKSSAWRALARAFAFEGRPAARAEVGPSQLSAQGLMSPQTVPPEVRGSGIGGEAPVGQTPPKKQNPSRGSLT